MLLAVHDEVVHGGIADDDRRVDEGVVVGCAVAMLAAAQLGQRGDRSLPARGRRDDHFVRPRRHVGERDEGRRAVQQREAVFDPVGAHRHLAAVDAILHGNRRRAAGGDAPVILLRLVDVERAAVRPGRGDRLDVPRVLANEVRPGRPDGHHQIDVRAPAGGNGRGHLDVMSLWRWKTQRVANRLGRALRARRGGMRHKQQGDPILCGHAAIL